MHRQSPINCTCSPKRIHNDDQCQVAVATSKRVLPFERWTSVNNLYSNPSEKKRKHILQNGMSSSLVHGFSIHFLKVVMRRKKSGNLSQVTWFYPSPPPEEKSGNYDILRPITIPKAIQPAKIDAIWHLLWHHMTPIWLYGAWKNWSGNLAPRSTQRRLKTSSFLEVNEGLGILRFTWSAYSNQSGKTPKESWIVFVLNDSSHELRDDSPMWLDELLWLKFTMRRFGGFWSITWPAQFLSEGIHVDPTKSSANPSSLVVQRRRLNNIE